MRLHPVISAHPYKTIRSSFQDNAELGPGAEAAASELDAPGWVLHDFDFAAREAVFVDVGEACNLFAAGFAYQHVMRSARRVARLGFAAFLALAETNPAPPRLIHLFNIGHCGSTLLHNAFNASGAAWCLSEPKFSFDLAFNRAAVPRAELVTLARAGLGFMARLPYAAERPIWVLKHFSQANRILLEWQEASPQATINLFMYRDAVSWCNSRYGFAQRRGADLSLSPESRRSQWQAVSCATPFQDYAGIIDMEGEGLRYEDIAALGWAMYVQDYHKAKRAGMRFTSLDYARLKNNRGEALAEIFKACGFPASAVAPGLAAFARDSHAGEATAHDKPVENLPATAAERIAALLAHPRLALNGQGLLD